MSFRLSLIFIALACSLAQGATLEKLSLNDMIQKSTSIVRARVKGSAGKFHGSVIYTHYQLAVSERWKGVGSEQVDMVIPGGATRGSRQTFSGAPTLLEGQEYVLFLWQSNSGLVHIIGLSQGLFNLRTNEKGILEVLRDSSIEPIVDPQTGRAVPDDPVRMPLADLRSIIAKVLSEGVR